MINFLQETTAVLKAHDKDWDDVIWVGTPEFCIPLDEFLALIKDIEYDDGYGVNEINERLIIVGSNWWLERFVYDGKEKWVFKTMPTKPCFLILPPVDFIYKPDYFIRSLAKHD